MMDWLKFICLSFFSNKISGQSVKRGYGNAALGLFFALVFFFFGVKIGDTLPFYTHYRQSDGFREFLYATFANEEAEKRVDLEINSEKVSADIIIDSFGNDDDSVYALNGYNLVLDTRAADSTYDDFEAYCLSTDGETEITYEEYLTLNEAQKEGYSFKIRYTGRELIITDELLDKYESYLNGNPSEEWELLKTEQRGTDDYDSKVYKLYVKTYYPSLIEYEKVSEVPLLRNYYYYNYVYNGDTKNYLFIFDDLCVGSFQTNGNISVSFYGFYSGLQDGIPDFKSLSKSEAEKAIDNFINDSFQASIPLTDYIYIMNILRILPYFILMPLTLAMIVFCISRLLKLQWSRFGNSVKIVGSYLLWSGILTALSTVIFGFLFGRESVYIFSIIALFAILAFRTVLFLIMEGLGKKKDEVEPVESGHGDFLTSGKV